MAPRQTTHIDVHIPDLAELLSPSRRLLERIYKQGAQIMAKLTKIEEGIDSVASDQAKTLVAVVDMADDIVKLVALAGESSDPAEIARLEAKAAAIAASAREIADKATEAAAVFPPPPAS